MKKSWLKKVSIFTDLTSSDIDTIMESVTVKNIPKDKLIVKEEDKRAEDFFIIKKGRVKVVRNAPDGSDILLTILGPGDYFGEMALIDGLVRSANVTALTPVEVLTIKKEKFFRILHEYPSSSFNLLKVLCGRLRSSSAQITAMPVTDVFGRVAAVLLSLVDYNGRREGSGVILEKMPPLQSIAEMSSSTKASVSQVLKDLSKMGYIKRQGRQLKIINYMSLKKIFT